MDYAAFRPSPLFLAVEAEDFPAQVIAAWDRPYRGRPFVVVDQDPGNHKTHVIACSAAAKEMKLRAGMPFAAVRRGFPRVQAVFRNHAWEAGMREELRVLFQRHTPEFDVRPDGKALLDLMGTPAQRGHAPRDLAEILHREILLHSGLEEIALGAAATRLLARVLARQARPDGLGLCPPGSEAATLAPLAPECLPGLSPQCRERIRRYALASVGQIRGLGREGLAARFGAEGDKLYTLACGLDLQEAPARGRGITAETVLEEDLNDDDALARRVRLTVDRLVFHLRREGLRAERITVAIRYSDHKAARRTVPVRPATDAFQPLAALAVQAFAALYQRRVALRSLSLSVPRPARDTGQADLFDGSGEKRQRALGDALLAIRGKGGFGIIVRGANVAGKGGGAGGPQRGDVDEEE